MFLDADVDSWPEDLSADVCLVGSGVMSLALTHYLLDHSTARLLLVEQGPLEDSEELSAVPAERNSGDLVSAVAASRAQGFGGSSLRWGGQALPFFPRDLEDRPFLDLRGPWPLTLADLAKVPPDCRIDLPEGTSFAGRTEVRDKHGHELDGD